jgi:hypothetical protein
MDETGNPVRRLAQYEGFRALLSGELTPSCIEPATPEENLEVAADEDRFGVSMLAPSRNGRSQSL